jgi:hypothetical protein
MHLTPRTLAMALVACIAGGLVLGIAGMVSPTSAVTPPTPIPTTRASSAAAVDLGDALVSYPLSTPPVDEATGGVPVTSAPPASAMPNPTQTPSASPSPSTTPTPDAQSNRSTPAATPQTRANATDGGTRSDKPRPRGKTPDEIGGWVAPRLRLGDTSIAPPLLTSSVIPFVTVMCSPSHACNLAGNTLTITQDAEQVSVTWQAPADDGWRAWTAARTYNAPTAQ